MDTDETAPSNRTRGRLTLELRRLMKLEVPPVHEIAAIVKTLGLESPEIRESMRESTALEDLLASALGGRN